MSDERKVGATYKGSLPSSDPIYAAGWNFTAQARKETARERAMRMLSENPNCRMSKETGTGYVIGGVRTGHRRP
jgi:hypothetical protein